MKMILSLLSLLTQRGSGDLYIIGIIGAIMIGSYFLTGGLMPKIDKHPKNPKIVALDESSVEANKNTLQLVNVRPACTRKKAVDFLLDVSGSMSKSGKLDELKIAMGKFLERVDPTAAIGIQIFDGTKDSRPTGAI